MEYMRIACIVTGILCFLLFAWVLKNTTVLRDESTAAKKPYSLGRTVLFFWTAVVVLSLHIIVWKNPTALPEITQGMLTLMGIVIATTGSARTIDFMQINTVTRHQDEASVGFLTDIVSDNQGVSIHRFQLVVFTIIFGAYIVALVIMNGVFPELDGTQLGLLGFSSGAYALLKIPENKPSQAQAVPPQPAQPQAPPPPVAPPNTDNPVQ